jgi:hypothetical protein
VTKRFPALTPINTKRDLTLLRLKKGQLLAVSCDAAGGIGSKPHDIVRVHPRIVGKMTARVALMELLSIGAEPISLAGTLCVEPEPTGNQLIKGVLDEVRYAGLRNLQFLWSSEKNVRVSQTGIGVTAVGLVSSSTLKIGRCRTRDVIVAIGEPHAGLEVLDGEKNRKLADTRDVYKIRKETFVHEMIPVGFRGIYHEAQALAKDSRLLVRLEKSPDVDLKKSAGPATVLLCAVTKESLRQIETIACAKPVHVIGRLLRG